MTLEKRLFYQSVMFLFNLSKSVVLCVKKCKYNIIFTTEPIKQQINTHDFLVRSAAHLEAFLIKQDVLFLPRL